MSASANCLLPFPQAVGTQIAGCRRGTVVSIEPDGRVLVDFPGNPNAPVVAQLLTLKLPRAVESPIPVLLAFEDDDARRPIILGRLHQGLQPDAPVVAAPPQKRPMEAKLDGKRVSLEADNEIELRCGKSAILLRKDGRIVVKGVEVVSRAARSNKIKGGTVRVN